MTRRKILSKAKPILFNTDMVRAILEGRKTVTRRLPSSRARDKYEDLCDEAAAIGLMHETEREFYRRYQPYFPNDYLYVRETWKQATGDPAGGGFGLFDTFVYKADGRERDGYPLDSLMVEDRWHPSIHMPKAAARIFLRVTGVRLERLQDMKEDDAYREGYQGCNAEHTIYFPEGGMEICTNVPGACPYDNWYCNHSIQDGFGRDIWDSTVKPTDIPFYGWAANPWVFVIEFEKVEPSKEEN